MHGDVTIRPAVPGDAPAVAQCVEEAYSRYIERIGKKPAPMLEDYGQVIENDTVHVLQCGDKLAGVLVLSAQREYILLENIAIVSALQGRSLGKRLMQFAERYAKEQGKREIRLYTNEKMYENIAIYKHCGYIEYGRGEEDGYYRVFFRKKVI